MNEAAMNNQHIVWLHPLCWVELRATWDSQSVSQSQRRWRRHCVTSNEL